MQVLGSAFIHLNGRVLHEYGSETRRRLIRAHSGQRRGDDDGLGRSLLIVDGDEPSGRDVVRTGGKPGPLVTPLWTRRAALGSNALRIV